MNGPHKAFRFHPRAVSATALILVSVLILVLSVESFPGRVWSGGGQFAPSNLTVHQADRSVVLNWEPPQLWAGSVTGYRILRRHPTLGYRGFKTLVVDTRSTTTTFTDTGITPGIDHVYRVKALRGVSSSGHSNNADINPTASALKPAASEAMGEIFSALPSWADPPGDTVPGHRISQVSGFDGVLVDFSVVAHGMRPQRLSTPTATWLRRPPPPT